MAAELAGLEARVEVVTMASALASVSTAWESPPTKAGNPNSNLGF